MTQTTQTQTTLGPRRTKHTGLRRMVKDGLMSPRAALDLLARRQGYVKPEIVAWLRRKVQS